MNERNKAKKGYSSISSTGDDHLQQAHLDFMARLSVASSASSVPTHKDAEGILTNWL